MSISRRAFLQTCGLFLAGAILPAASLQFPRPARRHTRVLVMGAGAAGLCAAYELQRAGYEVERVDSAKQLEALAASGQAEVVVVADTARNEGPAWLGPKEMRDYRVVVLTADDGTEASAAGAAPQHGEAVPARPDCSAKTDVITLSVFIFSRAGFAVPGMSPCHSANRQPSAGVAVRISSVPTS